MDETQNRFYSSIAKHYSAIFPFQSAQLKFVEANNDRINGKKILDIGCATGELAVRLAEQGAIVTAIDLNEALLAKAISGKAYPRLRFQKGDMLELEHDFDPGEFELVLCFGNTIVHLPDIDSVMEMVSGVNSVLKPGGKFLIQLLNYDYIMHNHVDSLPIIDSENITFVRNYKFQENSQYVQFLTELKLKKENVVIRNKTRLYALKSRDLMYCLQHAGFDDIEFFSSFERHPFHGNHLPLVVSCTKPQ